MPYSRNVPLDIVELLQWGSVSTQGCRTLWPETWKLRWGSLYAWVRRRLRLHSVDGVFRLSATLVKVVRSEAAHRGRTAEQRRLADLATRRARGKRTEELTQQQRETRERQDKHRDAVRERRAKRRRTIEAREQEKKERLERNRAAYRAQQEERIKKRILVLQQERDERERHELHKRLG